MIPVALAIAASAAPAPAVPSPAEIAPPLDRPLRLVTEEVRGEGRDLRRYRMERTLLFTAEPGGFRATMTLESATADGDAARGQMFAAANAGLVGRPIVVHLDRQGRLRSVDDPAEVWRLWSAGLVGAMGPDPDRRDGAAALAARLQQVDAAGQQRLVAGAVTTLVAGADERSPGPSQAAEVSAGEQQLAGSLLRAIEAGLVVSRLSAQSPAGAPVRVALTSERKVDPLTGLVMAHRRVERRTTPTGRSLSTEIATTLSIR